MKSTKINVAKLKKAEPNHSWRELAVMFGVSVSSIRRAMDCKDEFYTVRTRKSRKSKAAKQNPAMAGTAEAQADVLKDYLVGEDDLAIPKPAPETSFIREELSHAVATRWRGFKEGLTKEEVREVLELVLHRTMLDLANPEAASIRRQATKLGRKRLIDHLESIEA
ncbi:hypothetical protein DRQ25_15575 [Candidatus Fermentibacteria bacterium]|nr:MAG: hypothetical protein DRQ25_15575 [Candidatus Fermentibacteria bacterium]